MNNENQLEASESKKQQFSHLGGGQYPAQIGHNKLGSHFLQHNQYPGGATTLQGSPLGVSNCSSMLSGSQLTNSNSNSIPGTYAANLNHQSNHLNHHNINSNGNNVKRIGNNNSNVNNNVNNVINDIEGKSNSSHTDAANRQVPPPSNNNNGNNMNTNGINRNHSSNNHPSNVGNQQGHQQVSQQASDHQHQGKVERPVSISQSQSHSEDLNTDGQLSPSEVAVQPHNSSGSEDLTVKNVVPVEAIESTLSEIFDFYATRP